MKLKIIFGKIFRETPDLAAEQAGPDPKKNLREKVELILPDTLMIFLAAIMVPVVILQVIGGLPDSVYGFLSLIDDIILGIFIIEYFLKLFLARNILKHFLNPWHLVDLVIIVLPVVNLFTSIFLNLGRLSLVLRLLRLIRLLAIGSRAVKRRAQLVSISPTVIEPIKYPMEIHIMDGYLENKCDNVLPDRCQAYLDSPTHTWIDISSVSENDFETLSKALGVPKIILESELIDESYPRVDYFESFSTIFARIAEIEKPHSEIPGLTVNRTGLLAICMNQNVITISKHKTEIFDQILEKAKRIHSPGEPIVVTILYTIMRHILEKDKMIVSALESELITLENIPSKNRPSSFLETTFRLRKEVNQLVPSLLHLKEIISMIVSRRVPMEGFNDRHAKLFDFLMDEADYLHETASNAHDNLQSLIDLHINTTSFETNRVMRLIAVITMLGIIPSILGLLGSNIAGNPWNIQLWQVFGLLFIIMLVMAWVLYRLGWLKG